MDGDSLADDRRMPRTKQTPAPAAADPESPFIEKAARAVGAALGAIATTTGMAATPEAGPKKKSRLPRKLKKRLKAQSASKLPM